MRQVDTVARFAVDEFVVLCEAASLEDSVRIGKRIVMEISRPVRLESDTQELLSVQVGASVGVTAAVREASIEELLRRADTAMYRAKQIGKGRVEVATPPSVPLPVGLG